MLVYCWTSLVDGGPALCQIWVNASCLQGCHPQYKKNTTYTSTGQAPGHRLFTWNEFTIVRYNFLRFFLQIYKLLASRIQKVKRSISEQCHKSNCIGTEQSCTEVYYNLNSITCGPSFLLSLNRFPAETCTDWCNDVDSTTDIHSL